MGKKRYSLEVRGERSEWCFEVYGEPEHVDDWRADGLVVHEIVNTVPTWVVDIGAVRAWCFLQDLFNFKNPFRKG